MTLHSSRLISRRGTYSGSPPNWPRMHGTDSVYTFNSPRPTNSVSIDIPEGVDPREIVSLFTNLIGEVRNGQEVKDGSARRLDITFHDRDTATKALCMNGYTVGDCRLVVSALTISSPAPRAARHLGDTRRNLYVLGLPFSLTKNEFSSFFSQHGTVSHCVILATVDNSSRRRGFVVMSTHEEAKAAMSALTRNQIQGHTIDVSWAVVQRSQGFLDGGDRALVLDSRPHIAFSDPIFSEPPSLASSATSDSSHNSREAEKPNLPVILLPTNALVVKHLPTLLFSQAQDLHPLFFPFGHIDKLEIVHVSPQGTMSVIVHYSSAASAQEARDSLSGQFYGDQQLEAQFVSPGIGLGLATTPLLAPHRPPPLERRRTDPFPWPSSLQKHSGREFLPSPSSVLGGTFHSQKDDILDQRALRSPNLQQPLGYFSNIHDEYSTASIKRTFEPFALKSFATSYDTVPVAHPHYESTMA